MTGNLNTLLRDLRIFTLAEKDKSNNICIDLNLKTKYKLQFYKQLEI